MSPEQLSFMIGSIYGSTLTLLLFRPSRRSRNRRDPFLDCRDHSPNGSTIGYRSINYPDPSPDRRPTNPFNGERIPDPSRRKP